MVKDLWEVLIHISAIAQQTTLNNDLLLFLIIPWVDRARMGGFPAGLTRAVT